MLGGPDRLWQEAVLGDLMPIGIAFYHGFMIDRLFDSRKKVYKISIRIIYQWIHV